MIEASIVDLLNADATITSLIAGRISPVVLPETAVLPAITLRTLSALPTYELTGPSSLVNTRIEFTAWANDYVTCKQVIDAVRNALDFYRGILSGGETVQNVTRAGMMIDAFNSDARLFGVSVDYKITYAEM